MRDLKGSLWFSLHGLNRYTYIKELSLSHAADSLKFSFMPLTFMAFSLPFHERYQK